MHQEKISDSVWRKLLANTSSDRKAKKANVLIMGNETSGKRTLINAVLASLNQTNDIEIANDTTLLGESKKKTDHVYLMDYKYVRVNEFPEEDSEEMGKVNFYIVNRKYEHFQHLLTQELLQNLMIVISLDLDNPDGLTESFIDWINFISNKLMAYITELPSEIHEIMEENFEAVAIRNRSIYQPSTENDAEYEEPADITFSLKIPLLILANKSDALDKLTEQKALDFVQYKLRTLSVRYGAALMYVSSKLGQNVNTFINYLAYTMLDNKNIKLNVDLTNENLFVPFGFDQLDILNDHFQDCQDYVFNRGTKHSIGKVDSEKDDKQDISSVQDFLKNLKESSVNVGSESKEPDKPEGESQVRSSVFKQNTTKRILDILDRKKKI